ncbi:MAG TPA: histidine phosphatase family protein, partial [Albitalea sp.]|nr:histidine phosphatase family protein [Albitalea sp.]
HAQVRYFEGVHPHEVLLTDAGRAQASAARDALGEIRFDRVVTSGLPRTIETAQIVAPYAEPEHNHALREIESGELRGVDPATVQTMMTAAFRGVVPAESRFLGGESVGEFLDRLLPAFDRVLARGDWTSLLMVLHGGVNRALLARAMTGQRSFFGALEQLPACINIIDSGPSEWVVRSVNLAPTQWLHQHESLTTMEKLLRQYKRRDASS